MAKATVPIGASIAAAGEHFSRAFDPDLPLEDKLTSITSASSFIGQILTSAVHFTNQINIEKERERARHTPPPPQPTDFEKPAEDRSDPFTGPPIRGREK